jgi:hypothetical protein
MLNQLWAHPESSLIIVMRTMAMNGNVPKTRLIILYFPVRSIIHLQIKNEEHSS